MNDAAWPQELELELTGIAQGGDAVGRHDGRPVFVAGALPGEQVRVRLTDRQRAFARGTAVDILRAAPERVPSFCPLEATCSAGGWRWVEYAAQLRFKATILQEQLQHIGGIRLDVVPPRAPAAPPLAYRTTADLHVASNTQIGYYRPGSRTVADVPACCLHHPLINRAIRSLRPLLNERARIGDVTIRCSPATNRTLAVLHGKVRYDLAERWLDAEPTLAGVVDKYGRALDGEAALEQIVAGLRFRVSGASFFQINYYQWEPLAVRVRDLIDPMPHSRVLDLFCGVGLFALTLAREVGSVVGIESWTAAVDDARHNAATNSINNTQFHRGNVEAILPTLQDRFDRVVLDPPRRGCEPPALDALAEHRPQRIVYVSCHPGTLARDCKRLVAGGYHVRSAEIIDMFPHTTHVESIVVLER